MAARRSTPDEVRRLPYDELVGGIVITSSGAPAPEWSRSGEPPRGNRFVFGLRTTLAGVAVCALLLLVFFLLV